jgi:hypothetical protein
MAYTANKLKSNLAVRTYADDPADATVARQIAWVPMGQNFLALATLISGTGILTFKIFAAVDSSGTTPTEVAAHADPTVADAAGDQVVLEVSAEQVHAALALATHVSVQMDNDATNDINAVTYVMDKRDKANGLTADVIA